MEEIIINDIKIDVIRKNIKNIHLGVYPPNGRVRLAVPTQISEDTIRLFLISKLHWIKKHQKNFQAQERVPPREYKQRESHYFLGNRYLLNIIDDAQRPKVVLNGKKFIDLHIPPNTPTQKRDKILKEWYRSELKKLIPPLIQKWEEKIGVQVNDWQIKQMKTRWGTCNINKKRIWLNLELAKKPLHCIEYIIVHEMVHLLERNHNKKFIGYMDTFLPNWRRLKEELKQHPLSHFDWKEE